MASAAAFGGLGVAAVGDAVALVAAAVGVVVAAAGVVVACAVAVVLLVFWLAAFGATEARAMVMGWGSWRTPLEMVPRLTEFLS